MDEKRVYEILKLPVPERMGDPAYTPVGLFVPAEVPELMELAVTDARAEAAGPEPYTFEEYRRLCSAGTLLEKPEIGDLKPEAGERPDGAAFRLKRAKHYRDACEIYQKHKNNEKEVLKGRKAGQMGKAPDYKDYLAYIAARHENALGAFFRPWRMPIVEDDRMRHTIITGKTGVRKSTLIRVLTYGDFKKESKPSVIVFDPHGDLAEAVAKLKIFYKSDRLVYFAPFLHPEHTPVINPFEIPDKSSQAVELATNELIGVIKSVFETTNTHFTSQMETILIPCVSALMIRPNSTLRDLADFMDDGRNPPLLEYAKKVLENPMQLDFFANDFKKETYDITKQSIRTKLMVLFNSHFFFKCIVGKSTINLEYEMDRGGVIVFNLSKGILSKTTTEAMGRFYIGLIQSIALGRTKIPEDDRHPVHMFIDECEMFISEKVEEILKESRKYKLHLTLAQQVFGLNMSEKLKKAIMGNTAVKISGNNELTTLKAMSAETGADLGELQGLKPGEFHIKSDSTAGIKTTLPGFLRNPKYAMTPEEWEETKRDQLAKHYRRIGGRHAAVEESNEPPLIDL